MKVKFKLANGMVFDWPLLDREGFGKNDTILFERSFVSWNWKFITLEKMKVFLRVIVNFKGRVGNYGYKIGFGFFIWLFSMIERRFKILLFVWMVNGRRDRCEGVFWSIGYSSSLRIVRM